MIQHSDKIKEAQFFIWGEYSKWIQVVVQTYKHTLAQKLSWTERHNKISMPQTIKKTCVVLKISFFLQLSLGRARWLANYSPNIPESHVACPKQEAEAHSTLLVDKMCITQIKIMICTNTFCDLKKYDLWFEQIYQRFMWRAPNKRPRHTQLCWCAQYKYILWFKQIHFVIWTNTFCTLKKYDLQF